MNEFNDECFKQFLETGQQYFNALDGINYMVSLHTNGSIDSNAIEQIDTLLPPTNCSIKPMNNNGIVYVWSSSSPKSENSYSWYKWCESEMPEWILSTDDFYLLITKLDENILVIQTDEEFEEFEMYYGELIEPDIVVINWKQVGEKYHGVSIMRYLSNQRHKLWYNGWDVDSLVLWNCSGTTIKLITEDEKQILLEDKNS